jgi:hypothetical protein
VSILISHIAEKPPARPVAADRSVRRYSSLRPSTCYGCARRLRRPPAIIVVVVALLTAEIALERVHIPLR